MTEICIKCAECCKNYPFVEMSTGEVNSLEQLTELQIDVFSHQKGTAVGEYFLQFQENGDCFFLNENDGTYSCGVYEARPGICKNYPAKPRQQERCDANRAKSLSNHLD